MAICNEGGTELIGYRDIFWRKSSEIRAVVYQEGERDHRSKSEPTESFVDALLRDWWALLPIEVDPPCTEALRREYRRWLSLEPQIADFGFSHAWHQRLGWGPKEAAMFEIASVQRGLLCREIEGGWASIC